MDRRSSSQRGSQYNPAANSQPRFQEISASSQPIFWPSNFTNPPYAGSGRPYASSQLPPTYPAPNGTVPSPYRPPAPTYTRPPERPGTTVQTQPVHPQPTAPQSFNLNPPPTSSSTQTPTTNTPAQPPPHPTASASDSDSSSTSAEPKPSTALPSSTNIPPNPPETKYHVPPPPEATYPTLASAEAAIHAWTTSTHYELVRQKSDKNRENKAYKHYYRCGAYGKPSNTRKITEETRVRKRKSKKSGCTMALYVKAVSPLAVEGAWELKHHQNEKSVFHNHGPPEVVVRRERGGKGRRNKGTQTPAGFMRVAPCQWCHR